jgi:hypothetical protein
VVDPTIDREIRQARVRRQQYGSQKIKRKRDSGNILDIGFDYKGAATDALKKCASLIGVGLYLSRKEEQPPSEGGRRSCAPHSAPSVGYRWQRCRWYTHL